MKKALFLFSLAWVILLTFFSATASLAETPEVLVIDIDGVINPVTAQYLHRSIERSGSEGTTALVVRLNTPGGLEKSMREMSQDILNSPVPVIVFVAPSGARAASAGVFITLAAHVAAMAPGTNIGAAHPVALGGGQFDPTTTEKIVQDAAATARAIANVRGRNAEWAERTVRESISATADEALGQGVIDLVANDLEDLLTKVDGRTVIVHSQQVILKTAEAKVVPLPMSFIDRLLQIITDPNIAYILFIIGIIGLLAEFHSPGTLVPGIVGAISLILGLVAFGNLPINWAGVALLLLGVALFMAELFVPGFGSLAAGGAVAFVFGSLILFNPGWPISPANPTVSLSSLLVVALTGLMFLFVVVVLRAMVAARRTRARGGTPDIVGGTSGLEGIIGVAVSDLSPRGTVNVKGEIWTAVGEDSSIKTGEEVIIRSVDGVTLRVRKRYTKEADLREVTLHEPGNDNSSDRPSKPPM